MVVGLDHKSNNRHELSALQYSEAGVISGICSRALVQPVDVMKTRIQLQVEPLKGEFAGKYRGIFQSVGLIFKEEGLTAFWKGHMPGQALSIVFTLVNFSTFELTTKKLQQSGLIRNREISDFFCGSISGTFATIAGMPIMVLKTRMINQGEPKIYKNSIHAASELWRLEGASGFFRGTVPSVLQIAPYSGLVFLLYNALNVNWNKFIRQDSIGTMVCGAAAGALAKTVLYPLDLIRHRLQVTPYEERDLGKSIRMCVDIYKREKTRGLFKGLTPSIIKVGLDSGCIFLFYEMVCNMFDRFNAQV